MLRLLLLVALSASALGHDYGYGHGYGSINLRPYWHARYLAPIRLRYPGITDSTASYIAYYILNYPSRLILPHLRLQNIVYGRPVPVQYWVTYITSLIDLLPPVFYQGTYGSHLSTYVNQYYPGVVNSGLYLSHLALCDIYFANHLLAPISWNAFRGFYGQYVLHHGHGNAFPALGVIASRLNGYNYGVDRYFRRISLPSLLHGKNHIQFPTLPVFRPSSLVYQRITQRGVHRYVNSYYPYGWSRYINRLRSYKFPTTTTISTSSSYFSGLPHLSFLTSPVIQRDLISVLRLRFSSYPSGIIYSKRLRFPTFVRGFLRQWRPRYHSYTPRFVSSCLVAFDSYACHWLRRYHKFSHCSSKKLWGKYW
ncbi:uncharacterized protein LOC119097754 [Pollicipes pollicipes]|uniref:uncharacterized protein LOC119097754 n=1 Tax=Pollicipes pollicipes TaxID=41117 RepID=UPI00188515F5|nr:uncharacterized protein LOC119097754 [Pollicipes pollicipes]